MTPERYLSKHRTMIECELCQAWDCLLEWQDHCSNGSRLLLCQPCGSKSLAESNPEYAAMLSGETVTDDAGVPVDSPDDDNLDILELAEALDTLARKITFWAFRSAR